MTYETKSQYGNMLAPIVADFKRIPENRMMGKVRFKLATVLTLVLIALAAGRRTWNSFQAYGEEYHEFLLDTVPFFTSVPSGDAISRIVGGLDPSYLHAIILKHGKTFSMFANSNRPGPRPANARYCHFILDGKTVKGAVIPGEDGSMFHIVNVVTDKRVFVASMGVESKSNEIPVYPILIRKLFDAGTIRPGDVLSIDAMGCQRKVVELASRLGLHIILSLKGNQMILSGEVQSLFERGLETYPDGLMWFSTPRLDPLSLMPYNPHPRDLGAGEDVKAYLLEKGHGRLVERECSVIYLDRPKRFRHEPPMEEPPGLGAKFDLAREWIGKSEVWPEIKSVVMVRRKSSELTERKVNGVKKEKAVHDETRYYISNLALSPLQMMDYSINHWNVETAHWYLDMTFYEDDSKIYHGHAPENLSTIRKLACNFTLPQSKLHNVSLSRVMEKACFNPEYLKAIMTRRPCDVGPLEAWKVSPGMGFYEIPCQNR